MTIDRFNLITKMFKLKLKILINDILKKKVLDKLSFISLNKLIYNKPFKNTLIKQLMQIIIFKNAFNTI